MKPIALGVLVIGFFFVGCREKPLSSGPVGFDVTGLQIKSEASNPYALKVTGDIRERDRSLANKTVLLQIAGTVSFRSGVSQPLFAHNDSVLLTNGTGPLECWAILSSTNEVRELVAESATAHFDFRSDGYAELKPAKIGVR